MKQNSKQLAKLLRRKKEKLIPKFEKNRGFDFHLNYTNVVDEYLQNCFETSTVGPQIGIAKNPVAIIALGGYGRQEMSLFSDIDLLFLFSKSVPKKAEELIQEFVYPLWDIGLEVGHGTRSLKESLNLASQDLEVLTGMLDSRFICGGSIVYLDLIKMIKEKILKKQGKKITKSLIEMNQKRHHYFGDSTYLLEPNLKEGQGGLRDYHNMLWLSKICLDLREFRDLEYLGYVSHAEYKELTVAFQFIGYVRNRLHLASSRKTDQLHFEYQTIIADKMGYISENGQQPVEKFLGELHHQMECIKKHHQIFMLEIEPKRRKLIYRFAKRKLEINGLTIEHDMLNFESPEKILETPELLLHIFEQSAHFNIPICAEARRVIMEFNYLLKPSFINSPEMKELFNRILLMPATTFNVLNEMLNTGILLKIIPEFKQILNCIQYDQYHIYPVDKHSLRTVQTIKNFENTGPDASDPLLKDLYTKLKSKEILLWAALLHDIGKGIAGGKHAIRGAEIVEKIFTDKGFPPDDIETIKFLVREHLLLAQISTRRDINEEKTAVFCAGKIKSVQKLQMLYLLTVGDSMATGPKAWSEWTKTLMQDLFFKITNILEGGELASQMAIQTIGDKKVQILLKAADLDNEPTLQSIISSMSSRYLLYTPMDDILRHINLFENLGERDFLIDIGCDTQSDTRTIAICAKDRPGLFSKIAGTLTLSTLNILDANIYTWQNKIALDIFKVSPPADKINEQKTWNKVEKYLSQALNNKINLTQKLALKSRSPFQTHDITKTLSNRPLKVNIDNDSSSFFSILEVFAYDFPGLLYRITDALFQCDIDVRIAKIATNADQVVDVFYVRNLMGDKISNPDHIAQIKSQIIKDLST